MQHEGMLLNQSHTSRIMMNMMILLCLTVKNWDFSPCGDQVVLILECLQAFLVKNFGMFRLFAGS